MKGLIVEGYVLLMEFVGPKGEFNRWKHFTKLEDAKEYLSKVQKQTEEYRKLIMIVAPLLESYIILKTQTIQE